MALADVSFLLIEGSLLFIFSKRRSTHLQMRNRGLKLVVRLTVHKEQTLQHTRDQVYIRKLETKLEQLHESQQDLHKHVKVMDVSVAQAEHPAAGESLGFLYNLGCCRRPRSPSRRELGCQPMRTRRRAH